MTPILNWILPVWRTNRGPTETIALTASSPADELIPVASCTDQNSAPLTVTSAAMASPPRAMRISAR
jgi:hypothetical protein